MLIDSHCHLDEFEKSGELDAVLDRARAAGVAQMITVGTQMADWPVYARMAAKYPGVVYWTVGLHPTELGEDWEEALATLASWFATAPKPVAIGEVGLDYFHLPKDAALAAKIVENQKAAFKAQLEIALQLDCPVVVHARKSFADSVAMIDSSGVDWRKVVYHCFSEDVPEIRILNERGGRASFTGTLTYKNGKNVLAAALAQGIDKLMVETDCPYLAPEPLRGTRNEPANVVLTAEKIAREMGMETAELCRRVCANTRSFYGLD
jgi:TatD DNase family protein